MTESNRAPESEILEWIMGEEIGTLETKMLYADDGTLIAGQWFEGLPQWLSEREAERDFGIGFWDDVISVITFWDAGPESFIKDGRTYTRKTHQAPFGECECPNMGAEEYDEAGGFQADGTCYLCGDTREEGHGYLYLGEFGINIYSAPAEED